jgi:hypothetical protein
VNPSSNVEKILVQRGLLSAEALEQAVRLKERQGGSLAVNLVITGAVDDQTLSSFYHERYRLDPLEEEEIAAVDGRTFRVIPVEIIYDFGLFPVRIEGEEGMERLIVGMIDPSEPEVLEEASFFAALELVPKLMTIGQMARHYARLTGKRWKVDWETVVARRRIYQAKVQATSEDQRDPSSDGPIVLTNPVKELLNQTEALDHSLNHLFDADDGDDAPRSELVIALVSIDENNLEEEEVIELTRVKNRAASALPGKVALEESARPRVKRKGRGENRWILDPAEEGEVRIKDAQKAAPTPDELPKIIIDTALLSPEEAEARVVALEQELLAPRKPRRIARTPDKPSKKEIEAIPSDWLETVEGDAPSNDPVAAPRTLPLGSPVGKAPSTPVAELARTPEDEPSAPAAQPEEPDIDVEAPAASEETAVEEAEVAPVPERSDSAAPADDDWPDPDEVDPEDTVRGVPVAADPPPPVVRESKPHSRAGLAQGLTFELQELTDIPEASQGFVTALQEARERDEVGIAVAAFLRGAYERVVLWTLRGATASPWIVHTGSAPDLSPDRSPIEVAQVDALAKATGTLAYLGPVVAASSEATDQFEAILGGPLPLSAVTLPIHIGGRQIGVMYCDDGPHEAVSVDKQRLSLVRAQLAEALKRVILARKRRRRH